MKTKKPPGKKPHPKKTPKPAIPTLQGFDIEEYCAIGEWRRGRPDRLVAWVEKQRGKPISDGLHHVLLDLILGKPRRKQGGTETPMTVLNVLFALIKTKLDAPSRKAMLHDAAKSTGLSFKQVEKIYYQYRDPDSPS